MDTELFTFHGAINAWVLLDPDTVSDPLAMIDLVNDRADRYFHSVRIRADDCLFVNYCTQARRTESLRAIEASATHTPEIHVGDVLAINPRRFHKTNTSTPKHSFVIKFVHEGAAGVLSEKPVPPLFWPEVELYTRLVRGSSSWDDVLDGIRRELTVPTSRKALSAGFYPEKLELYKRMASSL
jgi:hypothetical protein